MLHEPAADLSSGISIPNLLSGLMLITDLIVALPFLYLTLSIPLLSALNFQNRSRLTHLGKTSMLDYSQHVAKVVQAQESAIEI